METLQLLNNITFNSIDKNPRFSRKGVREWLIKTAKIEGNKIANLNYNFCSDDYLLEMNVQYLGHNYYTDIITFDLSDKKGYIEGDVYISIDRVKENARIQNIKIELELRRVLVHGLLHLMGYKDSTKKEKQLMRSKENKALDNYTLPSST